MRAQKAPRTGLIDDKSIDSQVERATELQGWMNDMSQMLTDLITAAEELKCYRESLRRSSQPLVLTDLIAALAVHEEPHIRELSGGIQRAEVSVYRLGTLRLTARDGFDWAMLQFSKDALTDFLSAAHGVKFSVSIRQNLKF